MPSASCESSLTWASFLQELLPALDPFHSHGWDFCRSWGQLPALVMLITDIQGNSSDRRQLPRKWKQCSNALTASDTTGHFWHWQRCWCGMGLSDWIAWQFHTLKDNHLNKRRRKTTAPKVLTDRYKLCVPDILHAFPLYNKPMG